MLIDTHSHLYLDDFDSDRDQVVTRAKENGLIKIILPNIDSSTVQSISNLQRSDESFFSVANGLHPTSVNTNYKRELDFLFSEQTISKFSNIVAIGEIGMDLYWDTTFIKEQKIVLDYQLSYACENKLPVIIHCRNAFAQIFEIVESYKNKSLTGVFHCFSEDYEAAKKIIDIGFSLGVGGTLTYKKSNLPEVISKLPLSSILTETDSPYLSPIPHRGKRNESSFVSFVAEKISDIMGVSYEYVCEQTAQNAANLFDLQI